MAIGSRSARSVQLLTPALLALAAVLLVAMFAAGGETSAPAPVVPVAETEVAGALTDPEVMRGRQIVLEAACSGCHGGAVTPEQNGWLTGHTPERPDLEFKIGPCGAAPGPCFLTRPRNLTPDNTTGIGRFSERQIFNALRYGLRPGETADVEITGSTPGAGNFPAEPKYLAVPMPWPQFRHMSDADLRAVAAYLKRGVKPVRNRVADSDGPPDFWRSYYVADTVGAYPLPPFPAAGERRPAMNTVDMATVLRGRLLAVTRVCGDCHGGLANPDSPRWLGGMQFPYEELAIGDCGAGDCLMQRPRNLTPDEATGIGRYTDRQLFNALRYGLRPGTTPDVTITSTTPGQGNHPASPDYLGPYMPWMHWRHMPDADLRAIVTYLRHGVAPKVNKVADSDAPPDKWAGFVTPENVGSYPAPPFPARHEAGGQ